MSTAVFVTSIVHEMTTYFGENLHSFTRSIFHINTWMGRCISIYTVLHKLYKKWEVIYFTLPKFCKTISTNIALYLFFFFVLFYSFSSSSSSSSSSFFSSSSSSSMVLQSNVDLRLLNLLEPEFYI